MKKFTISNNTSGHTLGVYEGETADDALDAMARDAGYSDFRASCLIADIRYLRGYQDRDDLSDAELANLYVENQRADFDCTEVK